MLRSVLAIVDSASIGSVLARVRQLALAPDAVVTIAEAGIERPPLELHAMVLLAPRRTVRFTSVAFASARELAELSDASSAELVVVSNAGWWCWRIRTLLGRVPVLVVPVMAPPVAIVRAS